MPIVHVPYEIIEQWEDNFPRGMERDLPAFSVFSADEVLALREVDSAWAAACRAVSHDYPALAAVQSLPEWEALRQTAESALAVFERRGRLSEDEEVQ